MKNLSFNPGDCIGYLTLLYSELKPVSQGRMRIHWLCKCICDKEIWRLDSYLKSYYPQRKYSCGCMTGYSRGKGKDNPNWKGVGDISGNHAAQIRKNAKRRNLEFIPTTQELWELYLAQDKKCAISQLPISFKDKTASLDRINSDLGYTHENIQWVHKHINQMKLDLDQELFIKYCKIIANLN